MPVALEMPYLLLTAVTVFLLGVGSGLIIARLREQEEATVAPGAKAYHLWLDSSGSMHDGARTLSGGLEALDAIQDEAYRTHTSIAVTVQAFSHVIGGHTLRLVFDPRNQPVNVLEMLDDLDEIARSVAGGTDFNIVLEHTPPGTAAIVVTDMVFAVARDKVDQTLGGQITFRVIDNDDVPELAKLLGDSHAEQIESLSTRSTGAWVETIEQHLATSARR